MYININNFPLFFDVYGSKLQITKDRVIEKPTLIVLHGGHGFADHTLYVEFWAKFSDIAQVIFIDQRGCGRSASTNSKEWNLKQWADDLYQFCIALKVEKPIIAGVSMGGHVLCEFISRHYDYPAGLIFCNTEARFQLDLVCQKFRKLGGDQPARICHEFYTNPTHENFANFVKHCIPYYAKNAYTKVELDRCIKNPEVFLHYCREQVLNFNYLTEMDKIQCPTLLLVGQDSLHVLEATEEMAEKINPKLLSIKIFENAGAPVYKDKPKEAHEIVKNFLQQSYHSARVTMDLA